MSLLDSINYKRNTEVYISCPVCGGKLGIAIKGENKGAYQCWSSSCDTKLIKKVYNKRFHSNFLYEIKELVAFFNPQETLNNLMKNTPKFPVFPSGSLSFLESSSFSLDLSNLSGFSGLSIPSGVISVFSSLFTDLSKSHSKVFNEFEKFFQGNDEDSIPFYDIDSYSQEDKNLYLESYLVFYASEFKKRQEFYNELLKNAEYDLKNINLDHLDRKISIDFCHSMINSYFYSGFNKKYSIFLNKLSFLVPLDIEDSEEESNTLEDQEKENKNSEDDLSSVNTIIPYKTSQWSDIVDFSDFINSKILHNHRYKTLAYLPSIYPSKPFEELLKVSSRLTLSDILTIHYVKENSNIFSEISSLFLPTDLFVTRLNVSVEDLDDDILCNTMDYSTYQDMFNISDWDFSKDGMHNKNSKLIYINYSKVKLDILKRFFYNLKHSEHISDSDRNRIYTSIRKSYGIYPQVSLSNLVVFPYNIDYIHKYKGSVLSIYEYMLIFYHKNPYNYDEEKLSKLEKIISMFHPNLPDSERARLVLCVEGEKVCDWMLYNWGIYATTYLSCILSRLVFSSPRFFNHYLHLKLFFMSFFVDNIINMVENAGQVARHFEDLRRTSNTEKYKSLGIDNLHILFIKEILSLSSSAMKDAYRRKNILFYIPDNDDVGIRKSVAIKNALSKSFSQDEMYINYIIGSDEVIDSFSSIKSTANIINNINNINDSINPFSQYAVYSKKQISDSHQKYHEYNEPDRDIVSLFDFNFSPKNSQKLDIADNKQYNLECFMYKIINCLVESLSI